MGKITEFKGKWSWLSNFAPCNISHLGHVFPTVGNAYQASKCTDPKDREKFLDITPGKAKKIGRTVPIFPVWDDMKVVVMEFLLRKKFTQNDKYRELLISTGDEVLEEGNTWNDTFWGICPPGSGNGENVLGKLLMKIRSELK